MADRLLQENGDFLLQENGSKILLDAITPVGSVSVAAGSIPNNIPAALSGKTVIATISYLLVTWTPTSLGSQFAYYEVQSFEFGQQPATIAKITDESQTSFADFQTRRGHATGYRVRVVHVGGTVSAWTLSGSFATTPVGDTAAIVMASNANPLEAVAYYDTTPRTYALASEQDVAMVAIEGRDRRIGFRPAEQGGDIFTKTFLVAFNDPAFINGTVAEGRQVFEPLLSLLRDPLLPAITVLDGDGNRWYTTPKIGNFVDLRPENSYKVDVQFEETATTANPPVVVTATPWTPSNTIVTPPPVVPPSTTKVVPTSIDHTGATDVTASLQAQIDATPDGWTLQLQPNGKYRVEGTLMLVSRNVVIDLNGSSVGPSDPCPQPAFAATIAAASNNQPLSASTWHVADVSGFDPGPSTPSGSPGLVFNANGTGTVSQFTWQSKTVTGPGNAGTLNGVNCGDAGALHTGARIVQSTPLTTGGPDMAHRNVITFDGGTCTIKNGTLHGASVQGGTNDNAYIPALEEQHCILAIAVDSLLVSRVNLQDCFGDFVYLQWRSANPVTSTDVCQNVHLQGPATFTRNGRVAISPMAVNDGNRNGANPTGRGLEVDHVTMNNVRRSFYDIEPPTATCQTVMNCHDNVYGSNRLLFMSASGGTFNTPVGPITFKNETSSTPFDLTMYDNRWNRSSGSTDRRGPITFDTCKTTGVEGTPAGYAMDFRAVDGVTVINCTMPLQVRNDADMRLVHARNCTNVNVSNNNVAPKPNDANHQSRVGWEDDFQRGDTTNLSSGAPFATTAGYTNATGSGTLAVSANRLTDNDTTGIDVVYRASPVMTSPNMNCEVDIDTLTTDSTAGHVIAIGAAVRLNASTLTGYVAMVVNDGGASNALSSWHVILYKVVAGTYTELARWAAPKIPGGTGSGQVQDDALSLMANGSAITVQYNFVVLGTVNDTSIDGITTGGKQFGIHMRRSNAAVAAFVDTLQAWVVH